MFSADFLPNAAALKALNELIACGVSLGKISNNYSVIGHRQTRPTECPGESFYRYVTNLPRWTDHPIPLYSNTTAITTSTTTTTTTTPPTTEATEQRDNGVEENSELVVPR